MSLRAFTSKFINIEIIEKVSRGYFWEEAWLIFVQGVPLPTKPGSSLVILTSMMILQRDLNRSTFVVWEMKRNVSVVRLIVGTRSSGPPGSQPVSCLTRLSADLSVIWLRAPTQYGCCSWVLVYCVSSHRIVGKCIGILWRSECLLFANVLARTFQNMACRVQSCLEANGGHFQRMLWCRHISLTTNVLLFKFRCNIIIGVRIIKEMPGLVGSGTPCIFGKLLIIVA